MTRTAFTGARLFDGERFLDGHAVLVAGKTIEAVLPEAELPADAARQHLGGGLLVPGFIDAQVNGGGGFLFNGTPTRETVAGIAAAHARHGATALLPTFITDKPEAMPRAIAAVREAIEAGVPGVAGIHLEGPFLSLARKGAHDPALIRPLTEADVDLILGAGIGTIMLTVAVESAEPHLIRRLADNGVVVSLGHTDASYEATMAAADAGARGITHLYNAMSQLQHRGPGVVGAALDHGGLWVGTIADGHHVHPAALRVAWRAKRGPARLFLVSDAMPTAGDSRDTFELNGRTVTRRGGRLTLADGTLAGSDLTMDAAVRYGVGTIGLDLAEALRAASLYPAQFLRLDDRRGRIALRYRADFVHLGEDLSTRGVWIDGRRVGSGPA